jgi:hypothetical protein
MSVLTKADVGCPSPVPSERRFPPPWDIEEANNACFIVRDHAGQALAYVYFEDRTDRRITVEATSDE